MKENYRFVITDKKNGETYIVSEDLFYEIIANKMDKSFLIQSDEHGDYICIFDIIRVEVK